MLSRALSSRFAPPPYRLVLLPRLQLQQVLDGALSHSLTILTAPAGYGKTSLLAQWRSARLVAGVRVAWLSVVDDDLEAAQLLSDLILAIDRAGGDMDNLARVADHELADIPVAATLARLSARLEQDEREQILVIDDSHRVTRTAFEAVIAPLVDTSLPHLHVVLGSRERPPLNLAELNSRGMLLQLDAGDLRFTDDEARELLSDTASTSIEQLVELSEGWPVALQLSRTWLKTHPERVNLIQGFSGRVAQMADYLTEQVLADLPPDALEVLRDASILETFNADLVATVTGNAEAWSGILGSRKLDYLLVPVDEERYWLRYHHLLAEFLGARLRRTSPQHIAGLHARASQWFEAHGMLREAVGHASQQGDYARAAGLIEQNGVWEMVYFGGISLLRHLLRSIPPERLHEFPRVQLGQVLLSVKDGDFRAARQLHAAAREATHDFTRGPGYQSKALQRDVRIVAVLLSGYFDPPRTQADLDALYAFLDELDPDDSMGRATILNATCLWGLALGDMTVTRAASERAVRAMRHIGSVLGANYCYMHLGLAHLHLGARREAEATFREALALAQENFGADSGLSAMADLCLATALHARGDLPGAQLLLDRSLRQAEGADGWLDLYAEAYEVAAAIAFTENGDAGVLQIVQRMRTTAANRSFERLAGLAEALNARFAVLAGRLDDAHAALAQVRPAFEIGSWQRDPFKWRVHYSTGLTTAMLALARAGHAGAAPVLDDLAQAAQTMSRHWQLAPVRALQAVSMLHRGESEAAHRSFCELLEERVAEDDLRSLVNLGTLLAPLLHSTRAWAADHWPSIRGRQALASLTADTVNFGVPAAVDQPSLSPRELEVLAEVARGAPNKLIARALQMTENTVKFHLKNIYQKLGVRHRAEAVRAARADASLRRTLPAG